MAENTLLISWVFTAWGSPGFLLGVITSSALLRLSQFQNLPFKFIAVLFLPAKLQVFLLELRDVSASGQEGAGLAVLT